MNSIWHKILGTDPFMVRGEVIHHPLRMLSNGSLADHE
jgi:hypothetical protein